MSRSRSPTPRPCPPASMPEKGSASSCSSKAMRPARFPTPIAPGNICASAVSPSRSFEPWPKLHMDRIRIEGGRPLQGVVPIGGAKNAALPLMAAALLTEDTLILDNMPRLADITTLQHLLIEHGAAKIGR